MEAIGRNPLRDRLQIRDDNARKPVASQHTAELADRRRDLMREEMLDAMRRPNGIGAATRNRGEVNYTRHEIRLDSRVDIHPDMFPTVEQGREPPSTPRAGSGVD
jgi:hypothetical protein